VCPAETFNELCDLIKSGDLEQTESFLTKFTELYSFNLETNDCYRQRPHFLVRHISDENFAICMVDLLRNYLKCDLNHLDNYGQTLLFYAAKLGFNFLVRYLCGKCSANPNIFDNLCKQTAIFYAAASGKNETVELLSSLGADIDFVDQNGQTALFYAIDHGHFNVVYSLVKNLRCEINIKDAKGLGPIDYASMKK
jgi:ankyrin repeat protein